MTSFSSEALKVFVLVCWIDGSFEIRALCQSASSS